MPLQSPAYWQARAEEARANAENMRDERSRSAMKSVAHMYDSLAQASQRFADRGSVCRQRAGRTRCPYSVQIFLVGEGPSFQTEPAGPPDITWALERRAAE